MPILACNEQHAATMVSDTELFAQRLEGRLLLMQIQAPLTAGHTGTVATDQAVGCCGAHVAGLG